VALGFWSLDHAPKATAVVTESGRTLTYEELAKESDAIAEAFGANGRKTVGFIFCRNTPECLAVYLGALRSGHVACLLDSELQPELLHRLLELYEPDWLFTPEEKVVPGYIEASSTCGFLYRRNAAPCDLPLAPDLALLLTTSGSTGSPKLVRLTLQNLNANAQAIVSYLKITQEDRGLTSLPMSYSYGLSLMNSHLLAGAPLLMTNTGFLQRGYWDFVAAHRPTSLAGVPYHYEVILRMGMLERELPGLHTLTQAGGRLSTDRVSQLEELSFRRGWRFFVMYGQTEATARIAYVPPERLRDKVGSIGIAIPGGQLSLDEQTGELLYAGPNVMLGYAQTRSDLGKGDELQGQLRTGDLASRDEEGYYYITGRMKRFLKVYGKRFSLDEMEEVISRHACGPVACYGTDDHIRVAIERAENEGIVLEVLQNLLQIHPNAFRVVKLESLPRFSNSKLDYQSLARLEVP
jgi:acyl-CoA synthetase (AMP-forming)/AMP-acid ligase II